MQSHKVAGAWVPPQHPEQSPLPMPTTPAVASQMHPVGGILVPGGGQRGLRMFWGQEGRVPHQQCVGTGTRGQASLEMPGSRAGHSQAGLERGALWRLLPLTGGHPQLWTWTLTGTLLCHEDLGSQEEGRGRGEGRAAGSCEAGARGAELWPVLYLTPHIHISKGSMEADVSVWALLMSSFGGNLCVNSFPSSAPQAGPVRGRAGGSCLGAVWSACPL